MCLIGHREVDGKSGANVPNDVLNFNKRFNPDGFGIAWREPGRPMQAEKFGPDKYDDFHKLLKEVDRHTGWEYVFHYRRATHGAPCHDLSHPFAYDDEKDGKVLVFHNGIISIPTPKGESDTSRFVSHVLSQMPPRWWIKDHFKWMVEESIGYSRLAIMTEHETVRLGSGWNKQQGIWYSTTPLPAASAPGVGRYASPSTIATSTYVPPAQWMGEDDDDDMALLLAENSYEAGDKADRPFPQPWRESMFNHFVVPITADYDMQGDAFGQAECRECDVVGDYYSMNEKEHYDDISHVQVAASA